MLPKYPIKAQNATNTESTDVAVLIVPDGAISGNEVDISGSSDPLVYRVLEEPFATTEVAGETVSPLAFDVEAGHWYYITGIFYWQNGGADAMPVSFNGGTATVESFLANVGAGGNNSVFTGTDPSESTGSADDDVRPLAISVKFDGSGTFAPLLTRSGLSGQAILGIGSTWTMTDITPSA